VSNQQETVRWNLLLGPRCMKILYIANDRRAAELAAPPLRAVAPDVAISWAASLGDALCWIDENRDVATLIAEVESDDQACQSFVRQVRGLDVTAPVIVVSLKDPAPALKAVADEIVAKDGSFLNGLSDVVRRTLHTARPGRRRLRLLYLGDAALARECLGRPGASIEVIGAVPGLSRNFDPLPAGGRPGGALPFDILLIEHGYPGVETLAILRDIAARELHLPSVIVAEWDEELAALALELGAVDYIVKSKASFRAVLFRLKRLIAYSALLREHQRLCDAHLQARQDRSADAAAAAVLRSQPQSDFAARLAGAAAEAAAAAMQKLEQQLADRDAALRQAEQRAATERQAASQDFFRRRTELEAALTQEVAQRRILETKLAGAETWYQVAEQLRVAEAAASAEKLAHQHEEFTTSIAQAVRARDALEQRMNEALATIEQARQDRAADAAAAAEHLAQRETALISELGDAATTHERMVRRLADADAALRDAEQRAAAEFATRQQSIERQARIEAELALETTNRGALERQLAEANLVLQRAEEHHTSEMTAADARFAEHQTRYDARLSEAAAARQRSEQQHASEMSDAAARLAESQEKASALLAQAGAATDALERRLAETVATLRDVEMQVVAERQAASEEAAQREARFETELTREVTNRQALAQALADADAARHSAEQQHASEMAAAAAHLADHQQQAEARLTEAAAHLADHQQQAEARLAAAAAHFADHQQQAETRLTEAAAAADTLEAKLVDAAAALARADQRAAIDRQAATGLALQRQAEFDAQLAEELVKRQALGTQLGDTEAARQRAEQQHASEMSDAAVRLAESQEKASALLAQAGAATEALEIRLADTVARLEGVEMQVVAERHAVSEETAQREARFEAELTREVTSRQALAQALADADAARQLADQQHASELAAAAARLTEYQTHVAAVLAQTAETAEADRRRAEKQHASELAAAAARLAEYREQAEAQMAQAEANAAAAFQTAEQEASAERQAATELAARLQARLETELTRAARLQARLEAEVKQEVARRCAVEAEFADARAGSEHAQRRFLAQVAEIRQRAREHETRLEERAARERAEWERTRVEGLERIRHLQMEGNVARQSLVATEEQIQRLESAHSEERANLESAQIAIETDLARQRAGYTALLQTLDQTRATAQETLERVSRDRAIERARLEAQVADRDTQLQELTAGKRASDQAAAKTLADAEHGLRLAIAAGHRDSSTIARLQEQLVALGEELEATRSQREVLKTEADRVPRLRTQIDDIRADNRRQFHHTPVNMCRCSRDGAIKQVTNALANLLGYDTAEELQNVDFASTVFESGGELQWIVERCLASHSTESVETTWRRRDGSSILVRVLAVATTPESIDLAAQDITTLRVLEEKLRNSQRMEAVARYASEVAVTCDSLLSQVNQEGQQWLATIDSDTTRYHGELLLDEVTRAARFLRPLAVYGNEQKNAPELVDVNRVLRDLEPVLKRVAGWNIELVLSEASTPLNLDVEAERVERMLVNVAAYGRERMPSGGQLMIEVTPVVVDRTFVAKYPNVRPGAHVLLTVNEVRGTVRPDFSATVRDQASGANANASESDNPGVDLGALQKLVSDCGGHLWIMAEPPGNMVLKIHLPRRVLDRPDPGPAAKRPGRARWINWAPSPRS
jgi:PAS domain S-box-containing protein